MRISSALPAADAAMSVRQAAIMFVDVALELLSSLRVTYDRSVPRAHGVSFTLPRLRNAHAGQSPLLMLQNARDRLVRTQIYGASSERLAPFTPVRAPLLMLQNAHRLVRPLRFEGGIIPRQPFFALVRLLLLLLL